MLVGACGFLAPTPAPATPSAGAWERRADAPLELTEVAAAAHGGRIWVAGGLTADGAASSAVLVYDPAGDSWTEGPELPEPVHHSTLVSDGNVLRLIGGWTDSSFERFTDAVWRLDEANGSWVEDIPLPEARTAGAAAWDGSRIVYGGGFDPDAVSAAVLAFQDDRWTQVARLANPREHLAATSDGSGATYLLGGRVSGLDGNLGLADLVEGGTSTTIGELPTKRGGVAAFWWPTVGACLVGGESPGGTNPQVECIDRDGDVSVLPPLSEPRHGLGAAVVDGVAYVLLGGDQPGLFVSPTVEALELP
jgi:hypothetical protein